MVAHCVYVYVCVSVCLSVCLSILITISDFQKLEAHMTHVIRSFLRGLDRYWHLAQLAH